MACMSFWGNVFTFGIDFSTVLVGRPDVLARSLYGKALVASTFPSVVTGRERGELAVDTDGDGSRG